MVVLMTKRWELNNDWGAMAIDQNKTIDHFEMEITQITIVKMTQSEYEEYLENQNQNNE